MNRLNVSFDVGAGARNQPLVQLQRKSLLLPPNNNYTALSAALTTARTQYEIGGFPFLLGQESNSSGVCLLTSLSAVYLRVERGSLVWPSAMGWLLTGCSSL